MRNQYERLWQNEVRVKKRIASGVHSKKGKRGYVGVMRTTMDLLSPKEKREYTKAGKVRVYNMKDILTYNEFSSLRESEQKKYLEYWRDHYTNDQIIEAMNTNKNTYYELVNKFGLKKKNVGQIPNEERIYLTEAELETYKNELPEYKLFKHIVVEQQDEIFKAHRDKYQSSVQFAEAWGVSASTIYSLNCRVKKKERMKQQAKEQKQQEEQKNIEKQEEVKRTVKRKAVAITAKKESDIAPLKERDEASEEKKGIILQIDTAKKEKSEKVEVKEKSGVILKSKMVLELDEKLTSKELSNKLRKIASLIEEDNNYYQIKLGLIKLEEIQDTGNKMEIINSIMTLSKQLQG